jgi:hypothetical protein
LDEILQRMSRTAHFLVGLGILALCAVWCFVCFVGFIGTAIGRDSVPGASVYDSSFMMIYLVGGAGLICGLWLASRSFRRALRPPRLDEPPAASPPASDQERGATADEKLAHLVKKTER